MLRDVWVLVSLTALGCVPLPAPVPDDPCARACRHLRELGCVEGTPSPRRRVPCEDVCWAGPDMHPECVATVGSCGDVDSCFQAPADGGV